MKTCIAIDCGGSHITIALLKEGKILADITIANTNQISDLEKIETCIHQLCQKRNIVKDEILGIGMALPGIIDYRGSTLVNLKEKYNWGIGFDFKSWAKKQFPSLSFVIENDARLALLGETTYGVAKGYKSSVLFMLGTGVGTAAIAEGVLLRGPHNQAGILGGHFISDINGLSCNCGGKGCVEAQVGEWQLDHILRNAHGFNNSSLKNEQSLTYKILFEAYAQRDDFAIQEVNKIIQHWGVAVINLVHAYDPEIVVFSGGIMKSAKYIVEPVSKFVEDRVWTPKGLITYAVVENPNISALLGVEALLKENKK